MIIRNRKLVGELLSYALISQASHDVLDELVADIVEGLEAEDMEVEFETRELSERIDFVIHVLGEKDGVEAVRAAIDGELVIEHMEADEG